VNVSLQKRRRTLISTKECVKNDNCNTKKQEREDETAKVGTEDAEGEIE